jgi:hypothetical protein
MKTPLRLVLAAILLAFIAFALQAPQPIPPYAGDGNPLHDGQPAWCQNNDTAEYAHNCECMSMTDETCEKGMQESGKCKVYCRKKACKCKTKCDRQTR